MGFLHGGTGSRNSLLDFDQRGVGLEEEEQFREEIDDLTGLLGAKDEEDEEDDNDVDERERERYLFILSSSFR